MAAGRTEDGRFSEMQGVFIDAPGFSLSVTGDCPETLETVRRYLLPWLPRRSAQGGSADVRVSLTRNAAPGRFEVRLNDRVIGENESLPYLLNLIQQSADDCMIRNLDHQAVVHAGVVTYHGRAIVLPGSSGSGKTRMVQELLGRGAEYSSDEYAILDMRGNVHPYPRALMIRKDGDEQHPLLASELNARVRTRPAPVALFLFLRYDAGAAGLDAVRLDRSDALIRLLQNSPQILEENPAVLEPLKAAVSRADSFAGVRGESGSAAAEILRLIENVK